MGRLAERRSESSDEVRLGDARDACQRGDVQRLRISAVHGVPGAEQAAIARLVNAAFSTIALGHFQEALPYIFGRGLRELCFYRV